MQNWLNYTDTVDQHAVVGDLRILRGFHSPQLQNQRDIFVWLPDDYHTSEKAYPVLYMHDGQNLFDRHASFVGEWEVDETMQALGKEGYQAIIVGIPNNENRRLEYNPYPNPIDPAWHGRGALYLQFIVETVKPMIDATFRTLPNRDMTGIAGSSMGGLISLYGYLAYPDVFGFCGAFSTAYWFGDLAGTILEKADGHGKIYLDVGTKEGYVIEGMPAQFRAFVAGDALDLDAEYVRGVRELRDNLIQRGYRLGDQLAYVETVDAIHHEDAWAERLPDAFRFLLPKI